MPVTKDKDAKPRYRQLAETLMEDIRSGRLAVGERMPGELELVEQYQVSRHTVRESLRVLQELGLIQRHQGLGTVVRSNEANRSYVQLMHSPAELMQYPENSRLSLVETEPVRTSRSLARLLKCPVGSEWTRIGAVRKLAETGLPICWTDIYVLPEYAGVARKIGRSRRPVYEIIERTFDEKIESVEVDFRASAVDEKVAAAVDVEPGTSSLILVRRYLGRGQRQFEISVSEHPADRFEFSLTLKRGWHSDSGWTEG
ncbi:MAG: GntR family transcriptional regulator [Gammaproteobacteria bacterium]|nr:GntR family transcriptional regulator [Gammaproteobacteria bacterium]